MAKNKERDNRMEYTPMYDEPRELTVMTRKGNKYVPVGYIDEIEKVLMGQGDSKLVLFDNGKKNFVRKFDDPVLLWEKAKEYFAWASEQPWVRKEAIKSGPLGGEVMDVETARPLNKKQMFAFMGITATTWASYKSGVGYEEFHDVCEYIENVIEGQLFEGAAVGAFNPALISRALGMTDKKEIENKGRIEHYVASVTIK